MLIIPRQTYADEETFGRETARLGRRSWQLFGIFDDVASHNDFVRGSVWGTDILIQNFAGELRGYHNRCAHRGFPIRRERRGNGIVQCGFHGWVYNSDGVPAGIPRNSELFRLSAEAKGDLALEPVRVERLGRFVFVALADDAPPLRTYLGEYALVLEAVSNDLYRLVYREAEEAAANWKFCMEITLDDYHVPNIHPTTFGAGAPMEPFQFVYRRDGLHSCYMKRRDADWSFDGYWKDIREGKVDPSGYKIFQLFPNALVCTTNDMCFCIVNTALSPEKTSIETYVFEWARRPIAKAFLGDLQGYVQTFLAEDRRACELLQTTAQQVKRDPLFGKLEERVAWFHDAYMNVMNEP